MLNKKPSNDTNLNDFNENIDDELFEELLIDNELDEKCDDIYYDDNVILDLNEEDENENESIDIIEKDDDEEEKIISNINQDESESELDIYFKYNTNNHRLDGKHSLKRDTILRGKLNDKSNEYNDSYSNSSYNNSEIFDSDLNDSEYVYSGTIFENEFKIADDILNRRKLSEDVYNLLKDNTDLDFTINRRKPNKTTFNNYYKMILDNINKHYSKSEIFVELSYYFTDNIFNMYKLLDKKYATDIIMELKDKGHLSSININFM